MPKQFKNTIIEKNLKLLSVINPLVILSNILMLVYSLIGHFIFHKDNLVYIYYSILMTIFCTITFLLCIIYLKVPAIRKNLNNIPLLLSFIEMEVVCFYTFEYTNNFFNGLVIFVCIATIFPIVFSIEPLFYTIVLLFMGILMGPKLRLMYDNSAFYTSIIYIFIMSVLAMNRWFSKKRNLIHDSASKEHQKQLQKELEMASLVQKSFYHHDLSAIIKWDVAYYNDPMISLSGDLFDFFVRQDKLSGLCIFDVSGHGLSSGLVTMMVKNTMEEEFYENEDIELSYTMQRINKRIREEKGNIENYLTGIILRLSNDIVEMSNAGHPSPIIFKANTQMCEYFKCDVEYRQGAIGLGDLEFDFKSIEIPMEAEDRIVLYTDGITEAMNGEREEYGKDRFIASVQKHSYLPVQEQLQEVIKDIKEFIGNAQRTDDISIIILKKN